jgi:hypothetical protein
MGVGEAAVRSAPTGGGGRLVRVHPTANPGRTQRSPRGPVGARTGHNAAMEVPDVRYARSGGVSIAYQVFGQAVDLVLVRGGLSDLDSIREQPWRSAPASTAEKPS